MSLIQAASVSAPFLPSARYTPLPFSSPAATEIAKAVVPSAMPRPALLNSWGMVFPKNLPRLPIASSPGAAQASWGGFSPHCSCWAAGLLRDPSADPRVLSVQPGRVSKHHLLCFKPSRERSLELAGCAHRFATQHKPDSLLLFFLRTLFIFLVPMNARDKAEVLYSLLKAEWISFSICKWNIGPVMIWLGNLPLHLTRPAWWFIF